MPDSRFEEYFLCDTPETTFGDETLWNFLDAFTVHGPWHSSGTGGELDGPTSPPGEHSLAKSRLQTLWRLSYVSLCLPLR